MGGGSKMETIGAVMKRFEIGIQAYGSHKVDKRKKVTSIRKKDEETLVGKNKKTGRV